jgi:cell division protein FtsZ
VNEAAGVVTGHADPNANVIFGAVIDESMGESVRVTVIATGFGGRQRRRRAEPTAAAAAAPSPRRSLESVRTTEDVEIEIPSFLRDE